MVGVPICSKLLPITGSLRGYGLLSCRRGLHQPVSHLMYRRGLSCCEPLGDASFWLHKPVTDWLETLPHSSDGLNM